jgi:hypothetical protein
MLVRVETILDKIIYLLKKNGGVTLPYSERLEPVSLYDISIPAFVVPAFVLKSAIDRLLQERNKINGILTAHFFIDIFNGERYVSLSSLEEFNLP